MRLLSLTLVAWALVSAANGVENNTELGPSKTFLNTYCVSCHGNEKSKGGHNFETFNNDDWNNHELLNEILTVLKENEMPPQKAEKKPSTEESAVFEGLLAKQYLTIKSNLPGVLTRLNSAEYENTINDAFFTKLEVRNYLPVDNTRDGFDNEGDKLVMSPYAMDSYFRVASGIAEKVVGAMPVPSTNLYTYKNSKVRRLGSKGFAYYEDTNEGLTTEGFYYKDYSRGVGFAYDLRLPGYYDVKINGHFTFYDRSIKFQERDFNFKVDLGKENEWLRITTNINPKVSKEPLSTHEFLLSDTARVYLDPGDNLTLYSHNYFYPLPKDMSKPERIPSLPKDKKLSEAPRASLHFISAEVTGPFYDSWPPKNDFYQTYYEGLKGNDPHEKYQQFIRKLAIKLFRRPVSDKELKRYIDIAKKRYETDENVFNAVQAALTSMLCSPNFLYKYKGNSLNLDDYSIASRLSYFLWNSLPDDRLIKLASEGKLKDSSVRSAEALRMLQDPKAQRFSANFTEQWLELNKVDTVNPHDDILTHTFGDRRGAKISQLKPFLMQEGVEFLRVILNENLSLLNFIDSDFVVINRPLNQIYELELPEEEKLQKESDQKDHDEKLLRPSDFRKIMLDKESRRGGLLTQAGILMMTTNGEFTNPFYRGAWVAENIYGHKLTAPANLEVGVLNAPSETFTIKDNINEHRKDPNCASCHSKMDPFGLAMEGFDVLGRYRETYQKFVVTKIPEEKKDGKVVKQERITSKFVDTTKVDSDAVHRDGRAIDGMEGLKRLMLEDKDKIARNLLTKLSEYAMGREMNYSDSEMIDRLLEASKKNDYKLRDLMVSIIADESFTKR
tara:strand:+ start:32 stop:2554 length:2523 start_codon:yes stop_codon:yes gene_type:complete